MRNREPARRDVLAALAILAFAFVLWGVCIGRADIHGSMEARRAVVARQMLESGDYVVPRLGPRLYLAKPPLFPWAVAAISAPFGAVTATTVRAVSALCAAMVMLVLAFGLGGVLDRTTGLVAAGAFAVMPVVFEQAAIGHVNMLLALTVVVALFAAFKIVEGERPQWRAAVVCGVAIGAGLLTKGPVGLLFFVPTLLLYKGFRDGASPRRSALLLGGAALLLLVTPAFVKLWGPAFGLLYLGVAGLVGTFAFRGGPPRRTREWALVAGISTAIFAPWAIALIADIGLADIWDTMGHELWKRRITSVGAANEQPLWYYLWNFPAGTLPASLLAILAFLPGSGSSDRRERLLLLARCWVAGSVLVFTVASSAKSGRYLLPAAPGVALLGADLFVRGIRGELAPGLARRVAACLPRKRAALVGAAVGIVVLALAARAYLVFGPPAERSMRRSPRIACEALSSAVPSGAEIHAWGELRASVLFYLDPTPWETVQAAPPAQAFVCVRQSMLAEFPLPDGYRVSERGRVTFRGQGLVLLDVVRADAAIGGDG